MKFVTPPFSVGRAAADLPDLQPGDRLIASRLPRSRFGLTPVSDVRPTIGDLYDLLCRPSEFHKFVDPMTHVEELVELTPDLRRKIISLSQKLFPGPVTIETEYDPEFPEDRWHAVEVEASGEFRATLDRELSWHDRIWELLGKDVGMQFRLSVIPK